MKRYKANLCLLHNRYGDLELRVLEQMAEEAARAGETIVLPGPFWILMTHLTKDGMLVRQQLPDQIYFSVGNIKNAMYDGYTVTDAGAQLVQRVRQSLPIDSAVGSDELR
jgi:hypothetical protein